MPVRREIREGGVPVKVYTRDMAAAARQQLVNLSRLRGGSLIVNTQSDPDR
jgi:hypothetical protein